MPLFIRKLVAGLDAEALPLPGPGDPDAEEHGAQRFRLGFDVREVVREYGVLHSCILDMAEEANLTLEPADLSALAKSLNNGTSDAVSQYVTQREADLLRQSAEHMGFIAHELRNPLSNAHMAFNLLHRKDTVALSGPALLLERALTRLAAMIDNTLTQSWLKVGTPLRPERVDLRALLEEVVRESDGEALATKVQTTIEAGPLIIQADPRLLSSAVSNLVRNAIKFSHAGDTVAIRAWQTEGRTIIEVEDRCGGLLPGKLDELFRPFVQGAQTRQGFGLGLAIARQAAESHNGTIKARNLPGEGCVFVIDLPKLSS